MPGDPTIKGKITTRDDTAKGFDSAKKRSDKFKKSLVQLAAAAGGLIALQRAIKSVIDAAAKQELAERKLAASMQTRNRFTEEGHKALLKQAAALQKVTAFGDETIIEVQALLQQFASTTEEVEKLTPAVLDLSAGLGMDLRAAALLLGKVLGGNISALSRYGVTLDAASVKAEGADYILGELNKKFGGQAQAQAETMAGRIEQMGNAFGDLKEKLGAVLIQKLKLDEVLVFWTEILAKMAGIEEEPAKKSKTLEKLKLDLYNVNLQIGQVQSNIRNLAGGAGGQEYWKGRLAALQIEKREIAEQIKKAPPPLPARGAIPYTTVPPALGGPVPAAAGVMVTPPRGERRDQPRFQGLANAMNVITKAFDKLGIVSRMVSSFFSGIMEALEPVLKPLADLFGKLGKIIGTILAPVFEFLAKIVAAVLGALAGLASLIKDIVTFRWVGMMDRAEKAAKSFSFALDDGKKKVDEYTNAITGILKPPGTVIEPVGTRGETGLPLGLTPSPGATEESIQQASQPSGLTPEEILRRRGAFA